MCLVHDGRYWRCAEPTSAMADLFMICADLLAQTFVTGSWAPGAGGVDLALPTLLKLHI